MLLSKAYNFMELAYLEAQKALYYNEVPVGAIIVKDNQVIASSYNAVYSHNDPTAHAEILAIRQAAQNLKEAYLEHCFIYVTLEPCTMCAQAILTSRITRLYFGAYDPKMGAIDHGFRLPHNHPIFKSLETYGGIMEEKCQKLMTDFFKILR